MLRLNIGDEHSRTSTSSTCKDGGQSPLRHQSPEAMFSDVYHLQRALKMMSNINLVGEDCNFTNAGIGDSSCADEYPDQNKGTELL